MHVSLSLAIPPICFCLVNISHLINLPFTFLGSVILKVDSTCVADQLWYSPLLEPFYDHVPVKKDMSDLKEKIEWCRANDDKCQQIAQNAKKIHSLFVSKEGILDYMQVLIMRNLIYLYMIWSCYRELVRLHLLEYLVDVMVLDITVANVYCPELYCVI